MNFPNTISPDAISFRQINFAKCYCEVNSSSLPPVNISGYMVTVLSFLYD